jgi:hypothetical protein
MYINGVIGMNCGCERGQMPPIVFKLKVEIGYWIEVGQIKNTKW